MLLLHEDVATLEEYVYTLATLVEETFFISRREWVDRKESLVYATTHTEPKLKKDGLERLCEEFARSGTTVLTIKYYFDGQTRNA